MEKKTSPDSELYAIFVPNSPEPTVFRELKEVRKFLDSPLGKKDGTRFKKCADEEDLKSFFQEQQKEEDSPKSSLTPSTSTKPVSPYRSLQSARITEFRRAIEQKNYDIFTALLNENPRFLLNINTDLPAIVQEGYRFNAIHVACRTSNYSVVKCCLDLACDHKWLTHVYATDRCVDERSQFLLNGFLNTPDLIDNNTPLHYACKFGQPKIVRLLLSYSTCKRYPKNKYDERPLDMLCRGFKGLPEEKERVSEEIKAIFRRGLSPARFRVRPMDADGDAPSSPLTHLTASLHISNDKITTTLPETPPSANSVPSRIKSFSEARIAVKSPSVASEISLPSVQKTPQSNNVENRNNLNDSSAYSPMTKEVMKMADELRDKLSLTSSTVSNQYENSNEILESNDNDVDDEDIFEDASQDPLVGVDDIIAVSDMPSTEKSEENRETDSYSEKHRKKKISSDIFDYCIIL